MTHNQKFTSITFVAQDNTCTYDFYFNLIRYVWDTGIKLKSSSLFIENIRLMFD